MYSKKVKLKWAKKLSQCHQLLEILLAKLTQNQRQTHGMLELEKSLVGLNPTPLVTTGETETQPNALASSTNKKKTYNYQYNKE